MSRRKDSRESLEHDFEQHINWMQSLISDNTVGISNCLNYNSGIDCGINFGINDLISTIQPPSDINMPRMSDVYREYIKETSSYPPINSQIHISDSNESNMVQENEEGTTCEPSPLTLNISSNDGAQYRMSEIVFNEDESEDDHQDDCEEYYIEDAEEIRGQQIPDWARVVNLGPSLKAQQKVDPEKIFGHYVKTIDLSKMFDFGQKRYTKARGDSGWWDKDGLTFTEEIKYKRAVGFIAA